MECSKITEENKIGNTSHSSSICEGRSPSVIDASLLHVRQDTKTGRQNLRHSNLRLDNKDKKSGPPKQKIAGSCLFRDDCEEIRGLDSILYPVALWTQQDI